MRKWSIILLALITLSAFTTGDQVFYEYKKANKTITKLAKAITSENPEFSFGFQTYKQHKIVGATSFYNQPSDILHYILTTENNRTLHFQIPVLHLENILVNTASRDGEAFLEVTCQQEHGIKVKEHNQDGNIVFSLKFTTYQIPLPKETKLEVLNKRCEQLLTKVKEFNNQ